MNGGVTPKTPVSAWVACFLPQSKDLEDKLVTVCECERERLCVSVSALRLMGEPSGVNPRLSLSRAGAMLAAIP